MRTPHLIKEWWNRHKKSNDPPTNININLPGLDELHNSVDNLRKRIEKIEHEQGKSLPKEKIESYFIPGIEELEKGKTLLQYGQEAKAKHHLEEAIKFFVCAADALPCYETFFNLAEAYSDSCVYDNAKENYEKANQYDPNQPGAYNSLGIVYQQTGNYPKAEEYLQQTLTIAEKLIDQKAKLVWQACALGNLGMVCRNTGQMEQAEKHLKQALVILQKIGDKLNEANVLNNLGLIYVDICQIEQAKDYHQQALKIHREIGNKLGEASDLMNIGNVYFHNNQMEQVLEYHGQALNIFQNINNKRSEAQVLGNLGNVCRSTGQMEQALEYYQQAFKINRKIGNKLGEAYDLHNLGVLYAHIGQTEQAWEYFLQARAIFEEIGAKHLVKQVDENLAKLPNK